MHTILIKFSFFAELNILVSTGGVINDGSGSFTTTTEILNLENEVLTCQDLGNFTLGPDFLKKIIFSRSILHTVTTNALLCLKNAAAQISMFFTSN